MKTPRVQLARRLWIPGIRYFGETDAQAAAGEEEETDAAA